jgi:hypothetical protein
VASAVKRLLASEINSPPRGPVPGNAHNAVIRRLFPL